MWYTVRVLQDKETWGDVYKAAKVGSWYGKYRNELARSGIRTVADFALAIIDAGLEQWWGGKRGGVYRFRYAGPDQQRVALNPAKFGETGWNIALRVLKQRGFDWEDYVIEE